jgi:AcrR family transcriptional regulator
MTKKESKDKRVSDIIYAAVDEFLESGYERASMESIARRAGISKGGLYHHFKSKDEIFLLANTELHKPLSKMMEQALRKSSAAEALTWYIKNYLKYWKSHKTEMVFYALSMAKMLDSPSLWKMYERYIESYIAFFKSLYERGISSGEFIPHSAYDSAVLLMGALDGIAGYLIINKKLKLDTVISIYKEKFVHTLEIKNNKQQSGRE